MTETARISKFKDYARQHATVVALLKAAVVILAAMIIYSLLLHVNLFTLKATDSLLNDELMLMKQVDSIHKYGAPIGYFGYDQTSSVHGGLGAWSPLLIYAYAVLSLPFSGNMMELYYVNLILLYFSVFLILKSMHGKGIQSYFMLIPLISVFYFRFAWSGLSEMMFYFLVTLIALAYFGDLKLSDPVFCGLIVFASIMRPYMVMLIPLVYFRKCSVQDKLKWKQILFYFIITVCSLGIYFLIAKYYGTETANSATEFGTPFVLPHVSDIPMYIWKQVKYIISQISEYRTDADLGPAFIYCTYFAFLPLYLHLASKTERKLEKWYLILYAVFSFLVVTVFDTDSQAGGRHFLVLYLFVWYYLARKMSTKECTVFCLLDLLLSAGYVMDPYASWSSISYSSYLDGRVTALIEPQINADDFYQNTIAVEYGTDYQLFHALYPLQNGIAISFCQPKNIADPSNMKTRYLMLSSSSKAIGSYEASTRWHLLVKQEKFLVFEQNQK